MDFKGEKHVFRKHEGVYIFAQQVDNKIEQNRTRAHWAKLRILLKILKTEVTAILCGSKVKDHLAEES